MKDVRLSAHDFRHAGAHRHVHTYPSVAEQQGT
jgi:hypothetical protein